MELERIPRPLARSIQAVASIVGRLITTEPSLQEQINNPKLHKTLTEVQNTESNAGHDDPNREVYRRQDDFILGYTNRNPFIK